MLTKIILNKTKPWYGAGRKFGFRGAGLGIDREHFFGGYDLVEFHIKTKKVPYCISLEKAFKLIQEYKSWYIVKNKMVGVVPLLDCTALEKVNDKVETLVRTKQASLF